METASMSPTLLRLGIDKMSVEERMQLIDQIWATIPPDSAIPEWQKKLLDERIAEADANPDAGIPWEEALARLKKKP